MTTLAIIGAGSIGAVVAASAQQVPGQDVTVCVRTPFESLIVSREGVERRIPVAIATDPATVAGPADVVILAVKVQDTASAGPWLDRLCGPGTVLATLQNGLDPTERIAAASQAAAAAVLVPTVPMIASERIGPGRIRHHTATTVEVRPGPGAETVIAALGPEIKARTVDDFPAAQWRKLVGNVVVNPLTALTFRRADVLAEPAMAELVPALFAEAVAVATAAGVALGPDDADALTRFYVEEWAPSVTSGSSMYYDRVAGRPLEHEALTGELVAVAHRHGVAVPHHETLLALLRVLDPAAEVAARCVPG